MEVSVFLVIGAVVVAAIFCLTAVLVSVIVIAAVWHLRSHDGDEITPAGAA